ncbi:hypothetical protein GALMADRAFT_222168 [Galerina marginata CBS 339.88]|uniref:Uncharacterized protein n=1 Tax=Galerina marginata (strain CBS 339.88) TaxID=685588 RepID=A0A067TBI6_GALM3|nr:hypothetical protein GALMADRAFT_222168 [Galerina marginata CBS 339.88]
MSISTPDINISLEPHLAVSLRDLYPLLPQETAQELAQYLAHPLPPLIPYKIILKISQWARSDGAEKALKSRSLDPHAYSMIALLAGTMTSPDRKFGDYVPPKEPEEIEADRIRERKDITYLINALLSIACVGFAAWWAADKTGWANEWRVLFALFAAIVVAVSEAGLYLIVQSRRSKTNVPRKTRSARHKKVDPVSEASSDDPKAITDSAAGTATLRHRR